MDSRYTAPNIRSAFKLTAQYFSCPDEGGLMFFFRKICDHVSEYAV